MTDAFGSIDRRQAGRAGYDILNGQAWLELPVDIVMPAAREGQLTRDTVNAMGSHVRLVVEGANGPTTADGDAALEEAGIRVVPDVLANAGGVTCSYFEQVQGNTNYYWPREEVLERLDQRMTAAYRAVARTAADEGVSLREAASTIAIRRVVEACRLRGWV
jgi:glutamate dehydrogenase (NAD(P)+)